MAANARSTFCVWLLWALELVVLPSQEVERLSLTVSPAASNGEINLLAAAAETGA